MRSRFDLKRRTLLRGSGALIALPMLEAMLNNNGDALADGAALPKRIGSFFWGNGMRPDRWKPTGQGAEWELSEALQPLAPMKEYLTVMSGMNIAHRGAGHWVGHAAAVSGTFRSDPAGIEGPSFEQVAARAWKDETTFPSIDVTISRRARSTGGNGCCAANNIAYASGTERLASEADPQKLFDRLFKGFDANDAEAVKERAVDGSILDSVLQDAARLQLRVGASDKLRLEAHLNGLRELETVVNTVPDPLCQVPERGEQGAANPLDHEPLVEVNTAMASLISTALACDLARAFSIQFSAMQSDTIFWQAGASVGMHNLTHDDRTDPVGGKIDPQFEQVHKNVVFIMEQFGTLLELLKNTKEGDSDLLHQSAIMTSSDVSDGTTHSIASMPVVIAGRAGGALKGNYHFDGSENYSKAPLSCIRAVGGEAEAFGKGVGRVTDSVTEIFV